MPTDGLAVSRDDPDPDVKESRWLALKKHQIFDAEYKGHTIRLDNSGTFSEKLYLDDGLVRTGGFGTKMEFRFPIKAGEGIGDEIIVWFDAGFSTTRCRIEVESRG